MRRGKEMAQPKPRLNADGGYGRGCVKTVGTTGKRGGEGGVGGMQKRTGITSERETERERREIAAPLKYAILKTGTKLRQTCL